MIKSKDWTSVSRYFDKNLYGGNIPTIRREITEILNLCESNSSKLEIANFLLGYNTSIFLATISNEKLYLSKDAIDPDVLDSVIRKAFSCEDKMKYAIGLLRTFEKSLTLDHYEYIKEKCRCLNSYNEFKEFLSIAFESEEDIIDYLVESLDNPAVAFSLYHIYVNLENASRLKENSPLKVFRPSYIKSLCEKYAMTDSHIIKAIVCLLKDNVLHDGICSDELNRSVIDSGFAGFQGYLQKKSN